MSELDFKWPKRMHNAHKWMQNDKRSKMTRMAHRNKTHTTKTRQCPPRSKMTKLRPKKSKMTMKQSHWQTKESALNTKHAK